MKPRRRKGATLGLVAASVLVIILIGVACYFLAKIAGGGREVNNATDAGTLNVAKNALRSTAASVSSPSEFTNLVDPSTGGIDLYTYNRAVAQALLVAMNAQDEGTTLAQANAQLEFGQLTTLGGALKGLLITQGTLNTAFTTVGNLKNNVKMFGGNTLSEQTYSCAYSTPGGSSNIAFVSAEFPTSFANGPINLVASTAPLIAPQGTTNLPRPPQPTMAYLDTNANPTVFKNQYMAGYQGIGPANGDLFYAVPIFPSQKPHLITLTEFNGFQNNKSGAFPGTVPPNTPPNTFSIASQTLNSTSNTFGGSVACAIVGCANPANIGSTPYDFVGCIPNGYVVFTNLNAAPGQPGPSWQGIDDGTGNIFNDIMNPQGGQGINVIGPTNGPDLFYENTGSNQNTITNWQNYNSAGSPGWPNSYPGAPATTISGINFSNNPSSGSWNTATPSQMKQYVNGQYTNCMTDLLDNNWNDGYGTNNPTGDPCYQALAAFNNAFHYPSSPPTPLGADASAVAQFWSSADYAKEQICADFNEPYAPININAGSDSSGLGEYKYPIGNSPWNSGNPAPLEVSGATVNNLLDQLANDGATCMTGSIPSSPSSLGVVAQPPLQPPANGYNNQSAPPYYGQGLTTPGVFAQILQRANEIFPGITAPQLQTVLSQAVLPMGGSVYLYRPIPAGQTVVPSNSMLICSASPPPAAQTQFGASIPTPATWANVADGTGSSQSTNCNYGPYNLVDTQMVDSQNGSSIGDGQGDHNLHDQPYTNQQGSGIWTTDTGVWVPSSGYKGCLGVLTFSQNTSGSEQFSRPN